MSSKQKIIASKGGFEVELRDPDFVGLQRSPFANAIPYPGSPSGKQKPRHEATQQDTPTQTGCCVPLLIVISTIAAFGMLSRYVSVMVSAIANIGISV